MKIIRSTILVTTILTSQVTQAFEIKTYKVGYQSEKLTEVVSHSDSQPNINNSTTKVPVKHQQKKVRSFKTTSTNPERDKSEMENQRKKMMSMTKSQRRSYMKKNRSKFQRNK